MSLELASRYLAPTPSIRGRRRRGEREDPEAELRAEFWRRCAVRLREAELPTRAPFFARVNGLYLRKREDPYWDRLPVRRGLFFAALENPEARDLRVSFIVDHPEYSGRVLQTLAEHRPEIDRVLRLGTGLDMGEKDSLRRELFVRRTADLTDRFYWPEYHGWVVEQMIRLRRALRPHLHRALSQI